MSLKMIDVYEKIDFPVEKKALYLLDKNGKPIDKSLNEMAIVRGDTGDVLSVMSKKYNLVHHREMFDKALKCIEGANLEYKIDKLKTINNGAQIWIEFTLPQYHIVFDKEDKIDFRLIFKNSYNGTWTFDFSCGFFRLVCSNGLTIGQVLEKIRKKHTPNLNIENAITCLQQMIQMSHKFGIEKMTKMKQSKITVDKGKEIIDKLFEKKIWPQKYLELVKMNFVNKIYAYTNNNLFDVYNAFSRELNAMEQKDINICRTEALNMKAFESVWEYVN